MGTLLLAPIAAEKIVVGTWGSSGGQKLSLHLQFTPYPDLARELNYLIILRMKGPYEKKAEKLKYTFYEVLHFN